MVGLSRSALWARAASLALPVFVLLAALAAHQAEPPPVVTLRNLAFDAYQRWRPREYRATPVRIVDIDDESLSRLGQWPWPRTRLAEIVERLHALGAAAIAFDVVFAEPDRTSPGELARHWGDPRVAELLRGLPDHDRIFAEAVSRGRVVTGFALKAQPTDRLPIEKATFALAGDDPKPFLPALAGAVASLPAIEEPAEGSGALNFTPDRDGVIRNLPLFFRVGDRLYASLGAEALRVAERADHYVIRSSGASGEERFGGSTGVVGARIGSRHVATDARGRVWLHFSREVPERTLPAWKLLDEGTRAEVPSGVIALVGTSAAGLKDLRFSPLGGAIPGVEVHAQTIEQILQGTYLVRPDWAPAAEMLLMIATWILVAVVSLRTGPLASATVSAIAVGLVLLASSAAFARERLLLDPMLPSLAGVATFVVCSVPRHVATERERRWIRKAFSSYISPNLVEHLLRNPGQLRLGGERRECSFVLSDLAGFTSLVEKSDPEVVVSLLNEYLDRLIAVVFRHEGTLDRIVGDALVVMFSAPVVQEDHATRAVACAIEMDRFAEEFAAETRSRGIGVGGTRIGVNSGPVIIGNVGGSSFFDYRALGDAINTAARLETVNRHLGTRVCVSGTTAARCSNFTGRPAGILFLKGKTEGVEAFQPLSKEEMASPRVRAYFEAYRLLEAGDPRARDAFHAIPDDPLAAFHRERLDRGERGTAVVMTEK